MSLHRERPEDGLTSFEEAVKELKLQPDQYVHCTRRLNDAGTSPSIF